MDGAGKSLDRYSPFQIVLDVEEKRAQERGMGPLWQARSSKLGFHLLPVQKASQE